jgi:hypothetical protein
MAVDAAIFDFLEKIAMGFGATIAILAVIGLSIPARANVARPNRQDPNSR